MLTFYDKDRNILNFNLEKCFITGPIDHDRVEVKKELSESENIHFYEKIDFQSSDKKLFIVLPSSYYHAVADTLSQILVQHKRDPEIVFIINVNKKDTKSYLSGFYDFFFKVLNNQNIKYKTVFLSNRTVLMLDNFYYMTNVHACSEGIKIFLDLIEKYRIDKNIKPYRKVFISKRSNKVRDEQFKKEGFPQENFDFTNDDRLDDYELMSNYLSSLGFETIYAEDFDSFEEQIKYFDSVKILVSPTSAGLVNSLLMRKNQTVLEFEVPLITNQRQSLHSIYTGLCFLSGHLYISIPSMRNSKELINKINTNKKLLELISE